MKIKAFLVFTIMVLCLSTSVNAQKTSTYTTRVYFQPYGNGLIGSATMVYAFANCYGSAVLAYGYRDLQIDAVQYDGKRYYAKDLGENDLTQFVLSFSRIEASFNYGTSFVSNRVLTYIQDSYDIGCFGQTSTIIEDKEMARNPGPFSVSFSNAKVAMDGGLGFRIRNLEKERIRKETYQRLLSSANYESNLESKLAQLQKARGYADNTNEVDGLIAQTKRKLEIEKAKSLSENNSGIARKSEEKEKNNDTYSNSLENTSEYQRGNLANTYASRAKFYRDQAAKINPQYQFELEEKQRLLAEAEKYEQLHQKELLNQPVFEGSNETATNDNANSENSTTSSNNTNLGSSINRATDMSGSKVSAASAALATSAVLASQASRFGLGVNYGFGEIDQVGAEGLFLFSEHFGLRVGYGQSLDADLTADEFEDGYRIGAGIIYDVLKDFDGLGIGADIYFEDYQKQFNDIIGNPVFQDGNNLYLGLSLYLGIIKISYGQQISGENSIDGVLQEDYDSYGLATIGLYFYF